ncbi:2'-5' RNA ligase family protein [Sphingorhabdus sp. Alg239-R122]|uniref:2'-5' RNA ligase family protein n=1 Tax=Sphingorhabdus sp. Alg239-R122 TaxID=2305989 RepID=UPI0013DA643E|nr:2'-5' RNA ligase family protein [Sphingorhabdus sp. Alg239-R122]
MDKNAPIIMTALMGDADFAWANRLRQQHFPPERNFLDAHITLFHHLPPQMLPEIRQRVKDMVAVFAQPEAWLHDVMLQGKGVAYRLDCEGLMNIRDELAENFAGMLTPQDQARPRLHITVQNKVTPAESKALHEQLVAEFEPRPFAIKGIGLYYYRGGPWEEIGRYSFRGTQDAG